MRILSDLFRLSPSAKATLPAGLRIYAIGDVHGRIDLLKRVSQAIASDIAARPAAQTTEIFLGDYIDRGPDSRAVLDWLVYSPPSAGRRICLKGNHEAVALQYLRDPSSIRQWQTIGGFDTLYSYGIQPPLYGSADEIAASHESFVAAVPPAHRQFLENLASSAEFGGYFFVHAGVHPQRSIADQREEDMLWIRDVFLRSSKDFGRVVVHGHTPREEPEILPNRINIDTGAYLTGRLSCLVLEGETRRFL